MMDMHLLRKEVKKDGIVCELCGSTKGPFNIRVVDEVDNGVLVLCKECEKKWTEVSAEWIS